MDEKLETKWHSFWERFSKEFEADNTKVMHDLMKSCFLASYRTGYSDGVADANRKVSEEVQ